MTKIKDFRSDTVTHPTEAMRQAMMNAEVGDDVYGEDPTILKLEEMSAEIFGKESALFFPTGTMANQAAIMAHTNRGEEIITEENMHIYLYEVAGVSLLSGVQVRSISGKRGFPSPDTVRSVIRPENIHFPKTSLICLENSHNLMGGTVLTKEQIDNIGVVAKEKDLPVHLDGARIFNAATYLETPVNELTEACDTVMFCLSKGLSAPVGSMLVGDRNLIDKTKKCRKVLGGGMRQAGILAEAGIIALTDMIERLSLDHDNARYLAEGLAELPGIELDLTSIQTNIVRFNKADFKTSDEEFNSALQKEGIKAQMPGNGKVRMVTHKDISKQDVSQALNIIKNLA